MNTYKSSPGGLRQPLSKSAPDVQFSARYCPCCGNQVAVEKGMDPPWPKVTSNLIEAAPKLLGACKWALPLVLKWFNEKPHCQDHSGLTAIREAIARAEGRQP